MRGGVIACGCGAQNRAFRHGWRREMTGGPGLDKKDLSNNHRWRRATQGGRERPRGYQRWKGAGRPSQPGPCLGSAGQSRPGLGTCDRLGSPESARALSQASKQVTAARRRPTRADSVAGARARLAFSCLGSPGSESGRALPVSWVTVACRSGLV